MEKDSILIKGKAFRLFLSEKEIQEEVQALADKMNHDFKGQKITFLIVLNGAFMFASDLLKSINFDCEVNFIKISSYNGMASSGKMDTIIGLPENIENKKIVVLEDIVDTGNTLEFLINEIAKKKVASYDVATLFFKPNAFLGAYPPKYIGKKIANEFIVGYGMDYFEEGRNLKDLYQFINI